MKIIQRLCLGMVVISSCVYGMQKNRDQDGIDGDWDIIKTTLDRKKTGADEVIVRAESLYSAALHEDYAADNKIPKKQTVASDTNSTLQSPRVAPMLAMKVLCLPCILWDEIFNLDPDRE